VPIAYPQARYPAHLGRSDWKIQVYVPCRRTFWLFPNLQWETSTHMRIRAAIAADLGLIEAGGKDPGLWDGRTALDGRETFIRQERLFSATGDLTGRLRADMEALSRYRQGRTRARVLQGEARCQCEGRMLRARLVLLGALVGLCSMGAFTTPRAISCSRVRDGWRPGVIALSGFLCIQKKKKQHATFSAKITKEESISTCRSGLLSAAWQ